MRRRLAVPLVGTVVTMALLAGGGSAAAPAAPSPQAAGMAWDLPGRPGPAAGAAGRAHTVTLITGDVLRVTGDRVAIQRQPGRPVSFISYRHDGHLFVIPSDARSLLRAGRLDERLFDVTALVDSGYDDRRDDLPLIVAQSGGRAAAPADAGLRFTRPLPALRAHAARAGKDRMPTLWRGLTGADRRPGARPLHGAKVWLDALVKPSLDTSVPLIGTGSAWQAGYTGAGTTVAVLDTGIDSTHPDLAGKVAARANFTEGMEDDRDQVGHGTHVASTIAGSGAASAGRYRGVAPDARLLDGKVCALAVGGCLDSWIVAGMQWAADQGARVVNLSLGGPDTPENDPTEQAVAALTASHGVLFVVAAGNSHPDRPAPVSSPASADAALAVAATTKTDALAGFSNQGPRVGDVAVKPDIAAPGTDITAARSADGVFGEPGNRYTPLSGTSMAAPHVAGAAAILRQRHPDWLPDRLKAALMSAAKPLDGVGVFGQGAGRVDVARALAQPVTVDTPSASFGLVRWPHHDDVPVTRTITFRNDGATAVTLALAVRATGPAGPAPAGMFTVDSAGITVPAGGTASVALTADTRVGTRDGRFGGHLIATAGGSAGTPEVRLSVPFGVEREVESYDVTFRHTQRDGEPGLDHLSYVCGTGWSVRICERVGPAVRLPAGTYVLTSFIVEPDGRTQTMLTLPRLVVAAGLVVDLDARKAGPLRITVPDAQVVPYVVEVLLTAAIPGSAKRGLFLMVGERPEDLHMAQLGPDGAVDGLQLGVSANLFKPGPGGDVVDAPDVYRLAWYLSGRVPTGLERHLRRADLARVDREFRQGIAGAQAVSYDTSPPVGQMLDLYFVWQLPFHTPMTRSFYYNADGGAAFQSNFAEFVVDGDTLRYQTDLSDEPLLFKPGRTYHQVWNAAVAGPSLGVALNPAGWVSRRGDWLAISPPMLGDAAGHAGIGSSYTDVSVVLYRNGERIAAATEPQLSAEVPADEADYRVEVEVNRDAPLSRTVRAVWTFRSRHVPVTSPDPKSGAQRLPLTSVSFAPAVDERNTAAPDDLARVPLLVAAQPGSGAADLETLTVDMSTDDGATWHPVRVVHSGAEWFALVPQKSGSTISLRVTGTGSDGATVSETVIGAYRVR